MKESDKVLISRTMTDLIIPAFELINDNLLSRKFTPVWIKEPERHEIKFTGPNNEACEFSAQAETRRKTPEDKESYPVVVFNYRRGNFSTVNTGSDPVDGLTPGKILFGFKFIFIPWFR